jgi:hypothetical protein
MTWGRAGARDFSSLPPRRCDIDIRAQVPTHDGPLGGCSLLDSLRKGRFLFTMPCPAAESGLSPTRRGLLVG